MTYEEQARRQAAGLVGKEHLAPLSAKPKLSRGDSHRQRRIEHAKKRWHKTDLMNVEMSKDGKRAYLKRV